MTSLFESAGTVVSSLVVSPAADGAPAAGFVYYAEPGAAAAAIEAFDSFPFAGTFLEVRKVETAAGARVLATLAEAQGSVAGSAPPAPAQPARKAFQYSVPETATAPATSQAAPLVAPSASPAVAFASGPAVPMPAPLAPASDPASGPTVRAPFTAASESVPEPPKDGGSDYNPADWQPPSDWQPTAVAPPPAAPAATSAAGRWTSAAASRPKAQPQQREQAQTSTSDIAAEGAKAPEWEVDRRCRIFVHGLRAGCRPEDLRAYFSKFGQLLDSSLVPKQRVAFLTYAKGEHGAAAMQAANGCSIAGLSSSGSEPLRLEFRNPVKLRQYFLNRRDDVVDTPTTRVFIGYFPPGTKAKDVRAEVERYGDLEELMVGGGNDGGDCFCFVRFKRVQDAARAKAAIHGHTMPAVAGTRHMIAVFKEPRRGY